MEALRSTERTIYQFTRGRLHRRSNVHASLAALLLGVACAGAETGEVDDSANLSADASVDPEGSKDERTTDIDGGTNLDELTSTSVTSEANNSSVDASVQNVENVSVSGFAQKGPFLNGANLTLSELNLNLAPTGRTFQTTIIDDTGAFTFQDVTLDNSIAAIRVDGYFFNEVFGNQSKSQLTLTAITDLAARSSANINLVSHLEKARVEHLISTGSTYAAAKQQALGEVFAAFSQQFSTNAGVTVSEELDLSQPGANNAGLLAISSILLGYRQDASFSEILANVAGDLRTDGTIDSNSVVNTLVNHARTLDAAQIRTHLIERYEELGQVVNVPAFDAELSGFVDAHQTVPLTTLFDYPEDSLLAELFAGTDGMTLDGTRYDLTVDNTTAPMQVVFSSLDGGIWYYNGTAFLVTEFDWQECRQTFEVAVLDSKSTCVMEFGGGSYRADVYEGGTSRPAWSREFNAGTPQASGCGEPVPGKDEETLPQDSTEPETSSTSESTETSTSSNTGSASTTGTNTNPPEDDSTVGSTSTQELSDDTAPEDDVTSTDEPSTGASDAGVDASADAG